MTRRTFLVAASCLVAGCSSGSISAPPTPLVGTSPDPLPNPRELRSSGGLLEVELEARMAASEFAGRTLHTATYNGAFPGPTLRVRPGNRLRIRLVNNLPDVIEPAGSGPNFVSQQGTTNLHTHGLHVSPLSPADNIFLALQPGEVTTFEYRLPEDHPAGTFFYHPHHHTTVSNQMWSGMGGALIVEGDLDEVPEVRAARERVLVFQELRIDAEGRVPHFDLNEFARITTTYFPVNGLLRPVIELAQGEVQRWRLVHAGVEEYFTLELEGHDLVAISLDGNTLAEPTVPERFLLAAGNRADVLVRGGAPGTYRLRKLGFPNAFLPTAEAILADVVVSASEAPSMAMPSRLPAAQIPIADEELTGMRTLTFEQVLTPEVISFMVDGQEFEEDRVDQTVRLGAVEEWTVFNDTDEDHSFHLHVNPFMVVAVNGEPSSPLWLDTVNVNKRGSVTFRVRFLDFEGPSVLHCHVLVHECLGMMQIVDVVGPGGSARAPMKPLSLPESEFCGPVPRMRWGRPRRRTRPA